MSASYVVEVPFLFLACLSLVLTFHLLSCGTIWRGLLKLKLFWVYKLRLLGTLVFFLLFVFFYVLSSSTVTTLIYCCVRPATPAGDVWPAPPGARPARAGGRRPVRNGWWRPAHAGVALVRPATAGDVRNAPAGRSCPARAGGVLVRPTPSGDVARHAPAGDVLNQLTWGYHKWIYIRISKINWSYHKFI